MKTCDVISGDDLLRYRALIRRHGNAIEAAGDIPDGDKARILERISREIEKLELAILHCANYKTGLA